MSDDERHNKLFTVRKTRRLFTFDGRFVKQIDMGDRVLKDRTHEYTKCSFMLDSGATDSFISDLFISDHGITTEDVEPHRKLDVQLADGKYIYNTKASYSSNSHRWLHDYTKHSVDHVTHRLYSSYQ